MDAVSLRVLLLVLLLHFSMLTSICQPSTLCTHTEHAREVVHVCCRQLADLLSCRKVTDAEAEAVSKNEERAKVWKTNQPSNSSSIETTPNSSVEVVPKTAQAPASSSEPRSHSSPPEAKAQPDDVPSGFTASCMAYVSGCICLTVLTTLVAGRLCA